MLKIRYKSNFTECKYIMYQIIVNQSFIHIVATIKAVPVIAETKTGNHKKYDSPQTVFRTVCGELYDQYRYLIRKILK